MKKKTETETKKIHFFCSSFCVTSHRIAANGIKWVFINFHFSTALVAVKWHKHAQIYSDDKDLVVFSSSSAVVA